MGTPEKIHAIKVKQWLNRWDDVPFGDLRKKPEPHFYVFSISAIILKRLSKVYPRTTNERDSTVSGVQRKHDRQRSEHIRQYVSGGFPWSDIPKAKQNSEESSSLKMPGWLPTAIIANILAPETQRGGQTIALEDTIRLKEDDGVISLTLPANAISKDWDPLVPPIEIIDGQHRLWAFEKDEILDGNFDLPVVAFYNLDISWQAYLFYTINIKPKKINASLAFDLYPILRIQDWLEKSPEGAFIYKETRAQELVEVLWSYDSSPWKDRINMLGERAENIEGVQPTITQSAFIRSLLASFIKTAQTKGLGGLYGSQLRDSSVLIWNRTQQAAFLILAWELLANAVKNCKNDWAVSIRNANTDPQMKLFNNVNSQLDPAFSSRLSLMSTDQGVRGFLYIINDMVYVMSEKFHLNEIPSPDEIREDSIAMDDVQKSLEIFKNEEILVNYLKDIAIELVSFDWRTASTPNLPLGVREKQMVYKGSSGYKEIRRKLLITLTLSKNTVIAKNATLIFNALDYDK